VLAAGEVIQGRIRKSPAIFPLVAGDSRHL